MKKILSLIAILCGLIVLLIVCMFLFGKYAPSNVVAPGETVSNIPPVKLNPHAATYILGGQSVDLKNGVSQEDPIPGSSSVITTTYFGNDVSYDFDGDGRIDTAFIIAQNTGGTGTFYYVVAALNTVNGTLGSEGVLLGDRIAPQSTNMDGSILVVNYADRKSTDSYADAPTVGKSLRLKYDPGSKQFGVVVANFEGEADPARMTLTQQKWTWVSLQYNDGKVITPRLPQKFSLTFKKDGSFSASTDCNGVGGTYTVTGNMITFEKMMSTLMYCEGSQEADFSKALGQVGSYHFTSKGELIFDLKFDSGTMTFK